MEKEIVAAIIGALSTIAVAIISGLFSAKGKKKQHSPYIKLKQKQSGQSNTQIAIQNNFGDSNDER